MNQQLYHSAFSQNLKFIIVLLCFFYNVSVRAQSRSDLPSQIEIKIETSRPQLTAGTQIGIIAEIKNLSDSTTCCFHEKFITLTSPPEIEAKFINSVSWYASFPTETDHPQESHNNFICLKPGDTYKIFWIRRKESWLGSLLSFIEFSPGNYKFIVAAKYWTDPSLFANIQDSLLFEILKNDPNYRTTHQSAALEVAAPQSVILFGAAIGGLIAYILLPKLRRRSKKPEYVESKSFMLFDRFINFVKKGTGILGSMLLSMIITILLSRISEAQFLIRVTIADLWGAIAIGFVANYLGFKLLDKIITPAPSNQQESHPASEAGGNKVEEQRKDEAGAPI